MSENLIFNLRTIFDERSRSPSFHTASEEQVRLEHFRFNEGDKLGRVKYQGNVIITVYKGELNLEWHFGRGTLKEICQTVVPKDTNFHIIANKSPTYFQIIWSPAFAKIEFD